MAELAGDKTSDKTNNNFFVIRHGEAQCNVERLLVSDPAVGTVEYGLTELGRQQAKEAAGKLKTMLGTDVLKNLVLISSDFRRTKETAEILHSELQVECPIRFEIALRERMLGSVQYDDLPQLWALDEVDPTHTQFDCESVMMMTLRTSRLIQQLDKEYDNKTIILVSHGDPCQCLHTLFIGLSPNEFRTHPGMKNCEIRQLKQGLMYFVIKN